MFDPFATNGSIKINPYGAAFDSDVKERALAGTNDTLTQIVKIMRGHDLGADALPTVCRIFEQQVAAHSAAVIRERLVANREVSPVAIRSTNHGINGIADVMCLPNQCVQMYEQTQVPVEIIGISIANGDDWMLDDVSIGNRSQFVRSQRVKGGALNSNFFEEAFKFEVWRPGMTLALYVSYVGNDPAGKVFEANLLVRRWHDLPDPIYTTI